MDEIKQQREFIDKIDDQIMALLEQRFIHTTTIGDLKAKSKIVIMDKNRESLILDKTSKYSHYPQIIAIYKSIMQESRKLQRK